VCASSRDEVIRKTKATMGARKVILTVFVSGVKLVSLHALPPGAQFTQKYFINRSLPDIVDKMGGSSRKFVKEIFVCK
jgi:hypothetical protein